MFSVSQDVTSFYNHNQSKENIRNSTYNIVEQRSLDHSHLNTTKKKVKLE